MWQTYLSSVPKNKDYLKRETLDPLGLLEHLEHQACVTESLCSASMFNAFFNLTYQSEGAKRQKRKNVYESWSQYNHAIRCQGNVKV